MSIQGKLVEKIEVYNTIYLVTDDPINDNDWYIYKNISDDALAWKLECCDGSLPKTSRKKVLAGNFFMNRVLPILIDEQNFLKESKYNHFLISSDGRTITSITASPLHDQFPPEIAVMESTQLFSIRNAPNGLWLLENGNIISKIGHLVPLCFFVNTGERFNGDYDMNCIRLTIN